MCIVAPSESGHGGRFEPCEEYKRLQEDNTLAGIEARSVAVAIWRRRYSNEAPDWTPLDTTAGVVSQIDNMTAGLMNDLSRVEAENAALRQDRYRLAGIMEKADALVQAAKFASYDRRSFDKAIDAYQEVRRAG